MRTFRHVPGRRASAAALLVILSALVSACGDAPSAPRTPSSASPSTPGDAPSEAPRSAPQAAPASGLTLVPLLTYDGSGQAVHPDAAVTPPEWGRITTHVVATPYPGGQVHFENPSYYDVLSASTWLPPANATNPVVTPPARAYLSDPDMIYDPETRRLWMYYREVSDMNRIYLVRSADGVRWDAPVSVLEVPNHLAISPTVVRRGARDWLMWTVNGGAQGCTAAATTIELRHSADGVTWSPPAPVQIGSDGETPWHIDVEWIPSRGEYWAVYNAKAPGSCVTRVLRFATSTDGTTWSVHPSPLLRAGAMPAFSDIVYRASIAYDAASDVVTLLYSGASAGDGTAYVWQVASEQLDLHTLMTRTSAAAPSTMPSTTPSTAAPVSTRAVVWRGPDLTNETAP